MHVEVLHARHIFNLQDTVPLLWHTLLISESLRTSSPTFILITKRTESPKLKGWKTWATCAIFSSLQAISTEITSTKGCEIAGRQKRLWHRHNYILCKISNFLSTLDWERLSLRRQKQKASMMYKSMNDLAPEYLQSLASQRHSAYNLRNPEGRLTLSKQSTNYLKRSFSYSGAMLWNNLTKNLKNAASVEHFKRNIKKVADISDSYTAIM